MLLSVAIEAEDYPGDTALGRICQGVAHLLLRLQDNRLTCSGQANSVILYDELGRRIGVATLAE